MSTGTAVGTLLLGAGTVVAGAAAEVAGAGTVEFGVGVGIAAVGGAMIVAGSHEAASGWNGLWGDDGATHNIVNPADANSAHPATNPGNATSNSHDTPSEAVTPGVTNPTESSPVGDAAAGPQINTPEHGVPGTLSDLNPQQAGNYKRYVKKLPAKAEDVEVEKLSDGNVRLSSKVPANNIPNSYAEYIKVVDKDGKTIQYVKDTYGPDGSVIHSKVK